MITGLGVVSPIGIGKDAYWSALERGTAGIRPISLFDAAGLSSGRGGEITDFDAEPALGRRGLKYLDRSTQLAAVATSLALADAALQPVGGRRGEVGLVLGTTFGSIESISGFDRQILQDGPRSVNPMAFPRTVINSPAGHVAIRFGLTGVNATISAAGASSLHAIGYAADFIQLGRAEVLLAGGVDELSEAAFGGFSAANLLSGARGPDAAPFDAERSGFSLGEGAAILVLESARHAAARGAAVCGEILGFGSVYAASAADCRGPAAARAMRRALAEASIESRTIGCICAGANGSRVGDDLEARSIAAVFGSHAACVPIHSIKSLVGETLGASGALQVASSIMSLSRGVVPPTMNFQTADRSWGIGGVSAQPRAAQVDTALVNSSAADAIVASLVVGNPPFSRAGEGRSR